ncbi:MULTISPECIES: hypothetical protein [Bacillus]|uniref:hypothetical protein n=1 Tax=Bacillus TaxID=1386 RepID=UPI0013D53CE9|nr:hypothetical protein [Bacillus subtilis]
MQNERNDSTSEATEVELEKHLNGLPESVQIAIKTSINKAKENELIVGIDPDSYLAKEILWQSRKMIIIERVLGELNNSVNRMNYLIQNLDKSNQKLF